MENSASYQTFKCLLGSIPFYYSSRNCDSKPVTKCPAVKLMLEGCLRKSAKERGPVKKAKVLVEDQVKSILKNALWADEKKDLSQWRTAVKLYTYYVTFCRYNCYSKLTFGCFDFQEDFVEIKFPSSKNDQHYNGSSTILKITNDDFCPKLIYQTYFKLMDISEPSHLLNCKLDITGKKPRRHHLLSYTASLSDTKKLLTKYGVKDMSEKSFKSSGVSVLLDKQARIARSSAFCLDCMDCMDCITELKE